MARTIYGNRTGRAALTERLEAMQDRIDKRVEFQRQWEAALERLKEVDPDWEAWYDDRPEQTCAEMLPLIENRVADIEIAKFGAELRDRQEAEWNDEERERDRNQEREYVRSAGYPI
jgi:hypothetical protein